MTPHHHESRSVAGLTLSQAMRLARDQHIPRDAVLDAEDSDRPMIPGPPPLAVRVIRKLLGIRGPAPAMMPEPVLTWRVEDDTPI